MPYTPYHMGPGLLLKSVLNSSFSLMIFGGTQVLMDIQPLLVLITGKGHLHGFSHTILGSLIIACIAAISGKYIIDALIHSKMLGLPEKDKALLGLQEKLKWWVAFVSAYIGTLSHVFIDALMHGDVQLFYPINLETPLWGIISVEVLHKLCLYSGMLGAGVYVGFGIFRKRML